MAKKIIQDIIVKPSQKQEPRPEPKPVKANPLPPKAEAKIAIPEKNNYIPPEWTPPKKPINSKKTLAIFFLFVFLTLIFLGVIKAVSIFSTVDIKVTPKTKTQAINVTVTAKNSDEEGVVHFQTAESDNYTSSASITPTGQQELSQKASGTVAIFNDNPKSQFLVKETRLETPNGKIYKTEKSIIVPASGSIDVNVFADQPGQEFNIGMSDFKLPGFKGSSKYEKIFGRSKTEIKGGYVGLASVVSDEEFNKAEADLKNKMTEDIASEIKQKMPAGYLVFPGSIKIDFATSTGNPGVGKAGENVEINETAKVLAYLIKADDLTKQLLITYKDQLTPVADGGLTIVDPDKITFILSTNPAYENTIIFNLKGSPTFKWNINKDQLISELRAIKSGDFSKVLHLHPEIDKAEIIFSPAWWKFVPQDDSRVKYEEI